MESVATEYKYKPADRYIFANEDDDVLLTIPIRLPTPPEDLSEVDGYGLPPEKQIFKRQEYPRRLRDLERACETIDEIWQRLNLEKDDYADEWKWIATQWDRRINGYWFFSNGTRPTTGDLELVKSRDEFNQLRP